MMVPQHAGVACCCIPARTAKKDTRVDIETITDIKFNPFSIGYEKGKRVPN